MLKVPEEIQKYRKYCHLKSLKLKDFFATTVLRCPTKMDCTCFGNVGLRDACCQLFYNTPGFAILPCFIEMPGEVPAGMTVDMEVRGFEAEI